MRFCSFILLILFDIIDSAHVLHAGDGLAASVDQATGSYNITVDGISWLVSGTKDAVSFFGQSPALRNVSATATSITLSWSERTTGAALPWQTSFILPKDASPGTLVLRQVFLDGINDTFAAWPVPPSPSPTNQCSVVAFTDQTGGSTCCGTPGRRPDGRPGGFLNYTRTECCDACVRDPRCNAFVRGPGPPQPNQTKSCWLISGAKGTRSRADRELGWVRNELTTGAGDQVGWLVSCLFVCLFFLYIFTCLLQPNFYIHLLTYSYFVLRTPFARIWSSRAFRPSK